jgi:homoserine dehydrogenase
LIQEHTDFFAYVLPHFVNSGSLFFGVENEFNAVEIDAPFAGTQFYYGRGAGSLPTGAAVFNDVQDLIKGKVYPYFKSNSATTPRSDLFIEVYLRYTDERTKDAIHFDKISKGYISPDYNFVIGLVSIKELSKHISSIQKSGSSVIATGKRVFRSLESLGAENKEKQEVVAIWENLQADN